MHSNRYPLLVATVLSCATFAHGSAQAAPTVAWDLRVGGSFTGLSGELADSLDGARGGHDLGVGIRWPRTPSSFAVQAEFLWVTRSRAFDDVVTSGLGAGSRLRRSLEVDYAQVPLLARVTLRRTGVVRPYVLAGPYVAWRLSSRFGSGSYVGDEVVNPDDVRKADAGAIFGIGSDMVTARAHLAVELRAGVGAVDVLEERAGMDGAFRVLTLLVAFTP